jgi:SAM-dependent methyltransferase
MKRGDRSALGTEGPDRAKALAQYRRRAGIYDLELALFEPVRQAAIERLALQPGEVVLDVGCGTGLSLPALQRGVGPGGRVIGIEQSPEMIERARARVSEHRWRNVELLCAPVEDAPIGTLTQRADAALFQFTHDILCRPEAVEHVVAHLGPRARVVASGLKWARGWALPVNALVLPAALHSVTSLAGLDAPWRVLEDCFGPLEVESMLFGAVYVARSVPRAGSGMAAHPPRHLRT